jgi:hypothetical protein
VTILGKNFRLTKHGRQRFLERVGPARDWEILKRSYEGVPGFISIWKRDRWEQGAFRLVSIIPETFHHNYRDPR